MLAVGTVDISPEWIAIASKSAKRGKSLIKVEYYIEDVRINIKLQKLFAKIIIFFH